jgi:hypothetical protein
MVPTGTGFRDHHRTRVKKNIDFGEIGTTVSFAPRAQDADLEALVAGFDPMAEPAMTLAPTGSEGAKAEGEPAPVPEARASEATKEDPAAQEEKKEGE